MIKHHFKLVAYDRARKGFILTQGDCSLLAEERRQLGRLFVMLRDEAEALYRAGQVGYVHTSPPCPAFGQYERRDPPLDRRWTETI